MDISKLFLPALIIFDLDHTLWPFWSDFDVAFPCSRKNGVVVDNNGEIIQYFPEVVAVFKKIKKIGIPIAIAENCKYVNVTTQLLQTLDWIKYFKYIELYTGLETRHVINLHNKTKIPFKAMLFFNDDLYSMKAVKELGVFPVFVDDDNGSMTVELLNDGLKQYDAKQREKPTEKKNPFARDW